ncbi:glycosyltransferase family 39 protein [Candidatus Pacearchaeota archaeon]|nr:glycosyltransferase family 39 protein [Candidatus Pacearchaeota archaeon]
MEKEKIKAFLKSKENLILVLLILFLIIIRLYYFFRLGAQPIWWDEGDYLAISKVWSLGMDTPEWWSHFTGMRPLFLPMIWAVFFKLGLGELSIRFFTVLLPSLAAIYITYLLGKDLYNKKIGLISGFMMGVYWVFFFYSFRLLTDMSSVCLGMLCVYFFWSFYIKKHKDFGLYLSILFGVLAFSTRFPLALILITCAIYLLFVKKFSILKDKTIWKAGVFLFLCLSPYLIYFILTKFHLFQFYFGEGAVSIKQPIAWHIIPMLFGFLNPLSMQSGFTLATFPFFGFVFIIGILTFMPLILGFDVFWKQKNKSLNADFFVFLWLFIHLFFYIIIFRAANDRWLLMLMPAIFFIAAKGIMFVYGFIKKYSKELAIVVIMILLLGGAYQNFKHGIELTELKKTTYNEVKLGGLWLKENTPQDAKIITSSIVQNQYYSERQSYSFYTNDTIWKNCTDLYGKLSEDEYCQEGTEKTFNEKLKEVNPDYLIVSVFEPVFTPQWAYTYPQRYNLTPVAAFPNNQQPSLVIYKF